MLVKNWMSKKVITIDEDESIHHAMRTMKEQKVRMLPVMKAEKLVGILSDSDLKKASASDATSLEIHELLYLLSTIKVKDIMTKEPVTVPADFTVEETADVLMAKKISGVPVVDDAGRVVGIITRDDLFGVLIALSGLGKKGIQFAFQLEDRPGSIKEVTDLIRSHGGRIASIMSTYERAPAGSRMVYIRAYDIERNKLPDLQEKLQQQALMIYLVDHRENRRKIFHELAV